jgi:carbonic anhydrase
MHSIAQLIRRFSRLLGVATAVAACLALQTTRVNADAGADALTRLRIGNARFVADATEALPITNPRRTALAQGQSPFATVLSCADSRVPPEVIFHTGLGDLFVVRSAAHVTDKAVTATIEYGVDILHTPLLVVMGHESCGIVKAAIDTPDSRATQPNLDYLRKALRPAVTRSASRPADTRLRDAILANVEETINQLLDSSAVIKRLAETHQLTLVGGYYELSTGRVLFSEPVHMLSRPASAPAAKSTSAAQPAHAPSADRTATPSAKPVAATAAKPPVTSAGATASPAAAAKPGASTSAPSAGTHVPTPAPAGGAQASATH